MENIAIAFILILMTGFAARCVLRARRRGERCTGCPGRGCCAGKGEPCRTGDE